MTQKLKIAVGSYRDWSNKIVEALKKDGHHEVNLKKENDITLEKIDAIAPDLFFIAGWSWYVRPEVFNKYNIIGLHPSMLPKYRGGSPLQNQIIAGEKNGGVSLFKLTEHFDEGLL